MLLAEVSKTTARISGSGGTMATLLLRVPLVVAALACLAGSAGVLLLNGGTPIGWTSSLTFHAGVSDHGLHVISVIRRLGDPRGVSFQRVWHAGRPVPRVDGMATPQHPINSGFTADSTIAEVLKGIDLTGQLAVVTGGYSGIGTAVTRGLSVAGATVVVPARRPDQARQMSCSRWRSTRTARMRASGPSRSTPPASGPRCSGT